MIDGYPLGSNITILNVLYDRGNYREGIEDTITIVFKDLDTGEKKFQIIRNPEFSYYLLKSDASFETVDSLSYPGAFYRNIDDYHKVTTKYSDLVKDIAVRVGEESKFFNNIKYGNFKENYKYKKHYKVESTDHDISDYYMQEFKLLYQNKPFEITKAYLDIEVDSINILGHFPEMGSCPVNAVTLTIPHENISYTLILRNDDNPLISEFENSLKNNRKEVMYELFNEILNTMNNPNNIEKYGFSNLDFQFIFFDNEIELIKSIFLLLNKYKPDFTLAWNMAFDIPFIIERCKVLGYEPEHIMCDDEFDVKFARYYTDDRHRNDYNLRSDYATISSYTVFTDQLIHFASINSTKTSKYGNWRLDTIGHIVAGMRKLDYSNESYSIKEFPYRNFKRFIFYNIIDVLVQVAIENQSKNIEYIFTKSINNCTRYAKIHRQSIYLTNALRLDLLKSGYILCNNRKYRDNNENTDDNDEDDNTYPGAFVADPLLINDYARTKINNTPVSLFRNNFDLDYKGLYPHTSIQYNIGHESMIGKVYIDCNVDNLYNYKYFETGSHFIMSLHSNNFIGIGNEYLGLPTVEEMYKRIREVA